MAEHHLPPEPADHHHHKGARKGVHADDLKPGRRYSYNYYYGGGGGGRALCFALLVLLLAVGITWLVLYVVYRPSHPTLAVTSAAVLALYNATTTNAGAGAAGPTLLATSFQFTLVLRNPSGRSAARYDGLSAYAAYRGEPVTAPTAMPPLAQDAGTAVEVAPVVGGGLTAPPVAVSPGAAAALAADVAYGVLPLRVVVLGRVRFVSGPFHRGWHSLYARCDLLLGVSGGKAAAGSAGGVPQHQQAPLLADPVCNVDM